MGDFKRLLAWRLARELVRDLHTAFSGQRSNGYPGLRAQILRAAASIPSNLAEGCAKRSRRELARFAEMAYASAKEVECDLILSRDVSILSVQHFEDLAQRTDHVARLCYGLTRIDDSPPNPD
jgi:four helix bundle protein